MVCTHENGGTRLYPQNILKERNTHDIEERKDDAKDGVKQTNEIKRNVISFIRH